MKEVSAVGEMPASTGVHLQITDAGGHVLPLEGAIFVVILRLDKRTDLVKRTHQMVYHCKKTEKLVLLREAMSQLGMVTANITMRHLFARLGVLCHLAPAACRTGM